MTKRLSLERFPLHLGLGARAVPQPEFHWRAGDYPILLHGTPRHSHAIVPGGFDVMS